jgi:hypothetical protein
MISPTKRFLENIGPIEEYPIKHRAINRCNI